MAKVSGVDKLVGQIQARIDAQMADVKMGVVVGYSAPYALYVHENLEAHHDNGQAKYLEQPARSMIDEMRLTVKSMLMAGKSLSQSLYRAGLLLQAASQKLVPVDTGVLKSSAFTKITTEV